MTRSCIRHRFAPLCTDCIQDPAQQAGGSADYAKKVEGHSRELEENFTLATGDNRNVEKLSKTPLEGAAHTIQYAGVFGGRAGNAGIPDVRVADDALSVALFTETADGNARLLAAHDQIWVVLRHFLFLA